jgi:hypothetical protein
MKSLAEQLKPIARQNIQALRAISASARNQRDYKYAQRVDLQARKWTSIASRGGR